MAIKIQNFRRKLFGALSFSTALFVFQACYGAPQDRYKDDILVRGTVLSETTEQPVEGIKIIINNSSQFAITDTSGSFSFYVPAASQYHLLLSDIDSLSNGYFIDKDTVVSDIPDNGILIKMKSAN